MAESKRWVEAVQIALGKRRIPDHWFDTEDGRIANRLRHMMASR